MSEIAEIIDTLESRIEKLFTKVKSLEEKNQELQHQLKYAATNLNNQSQTVETLKKDYETLKITNSLLGSDDYKRDTKLKINSLIREIDYCIAQLSD
jgi:restriction endonuclease S subunit